MSFDQIKVLIVNYPDRKYLVMRYVDPITGKGKARSTGTINRREAERAAAKWEAELREGRYRPASQITWQEFRERHEKEKLSSLSPRTLSSTDTAFNHLEKTINPAKLSALNANTLSRFQSDLRATGVAETTIATHLRHIRAALSWALAMGLVSEVPKIIMPKRARGITLMRGRPITAEEFERMIAVVPYVRPDDSEAWQRLLTGQWLSGFRLEESLVASWDDDAPIYIDLNKRRPRLRIYAEAEKGHQDRVLPLAPDFVEFLRKTPEVDREGPVFPIVALSTEHPMTPGRVGRVISDIGEQAKVVVNKTANKFASAQDLRRSFGTRWAKRVKPATLQLLMRHRSIETTMKYYVGLTADDVADELWQAYTQGISAKTLRSADDATSR